MRARTDRQTHGTHIRWKHYLRLSLRSLGGDNKYLCKRSDELCYKVRRETRRSQYEHTDPRSSVHQNPSYDTWTDCRPTSRWRCWLLQVLSCKVLSSMTVCYRHCYNTQQSNITDVHDSKCRQLGTPGCRPMNFKMIYRPMWRVLSRCLGLSLHSAATENHLFTKSFTGYFLNIN